MKQYNLVQNMWYVFKMQIKQQKSFKWLLPLSIFFSIALPIMATLIPTLIVGAIETDIELIYFIIGIGGIVVLYACVNSLNSYILEILSWENTFIRINGSFFDMAKKNLQMDYANLEPQSSRIRLQKAQYAIMSNWVGVERVMKSTPLFIINLAGIILYAFFLTRVSLIILLILFLMTISNILLSLNANRYSEKTNPKIDDNLNRLNYLNSSAKKTENAKDIRIYKMQTWFQKMSTVLIFRLTKLIGKQERVKNLPSFSDSIFTIIRDILAYSILVKEVLNGTLTPTEFTFFLGIIMGFTTWLNGFTEEFLHLKLASTRITDFRHFLTYPDKFLREDGESCEELMNKELSIRFENVSFSYPDAERSTIENLSFEIKAGEKIALVGINGAGKTTIIKLLTGMYMPTSGRILVGGKDITKLNILEYYKLIGAIYQDVEIVAYTIAENISCKVEEETDFMRVKSCLKLADLDDKVDSLPLKDKTFLTKMIDANGIELSGGQKQKLMLARALYKNAPILILDEPTAALDPLAELDLYKKYNDLTKDKTSIFISHRLSSTQFCNRIFFLENGTIIEEGTHQELMKNEGKYRQMFDIQAQYYKEEAVNGN